MDRLIPLAIGAAIVAGAYFYGRSNGLEEGRRAQLEASIKSEKERKNVDEAVRSLGDYDLCLRLGGVPDDCNALRRVGAAAETE